jgi:hypothetical protein
LATAFLGCIPVLLWEGATFPNAAMSFMKQGRSRCLVPNHVLNKTKKQEEMEGGVVGLQQEPPGRPPLIHQYNRLDKVHVT